MNTHGRDACQAVLGRDPLLAQPAGSARVDAVWDSSVFGRACKGGSCSWTVDGSCRAGQDWTGGGIVEESLRAGAGSKSEGTVIPGGEHTAPVRRLGESVDVQWHCWMVRTQGELACVLAACLPSSRCRVRGADPRGANKARSLAAPAGCAVAQSSSRHTPADARSASSSSWEESRL